MIKEIKLINLQDGFFSTFYQSVPLNIEDNQTIINSYEIKNYYEVF